MDLILTQQSEAVNLALSFSDLYSIFNLIQLFLNHISLLPISVRVCICLNLISFAAQQSFASAARSQGVWHNP